MLFGHQTNDIAPQAATTPAPAGSITTPTAPPIVDTPVATPDPQPGVNPLAVDPETGVSLPVAPPEPLSEEDLAEPSVLNQPMNEPATPPVPPPSGFTTDTPSADPFAPDPAYLDALSADSTPAPAPEPTDVSAPTEPVQPEATSEPAPYADTAPTAPAAPSTPAAPGELLGLKQQAMTELSPLLGQLDQTPEERFRTTMMMIQSTDNPGLIGQAYDAAKQITDDKARAQALLDVINEINYFTQHQPTN